MSGLAGKRVLVVEDEALVAAMVEDILSGLGALVAGPARTIAEALSLAEGGDFDVALLDVNLRGERVGPVAALLAGRGVPVVLATGYGEAATRDLPAAAVIDKPYTPDALKGALLAALAGR